jgi:hypothetical protein
MIRETLSMLLAGFFLLQPAVYARAAGAQAANDNPQAAAIRQKVEAAGIGSQVEVRLLDKNKILGRLMSVGSDDFVVKTGEDQTAVVHTIRFGDVESVKTATAVAISNAGSRGSRMSRRGKIMLVVGIAALVFGVITYATTKGP